MLPGAGGAANAIVGASAATPAASKVIVRFMLELLLRHPLLVNANREIAPAPETPRYAARSLRRTGELSRLATPWTC